MTSIAPRTPPLLAPVALRGVTLRNRLVVSPMCQYSAVDGHPTDLHLVHLGRFAIGGFGMVVLEATAVERDGRITPGDLGIWSDEHVAPLARIAAFLREHGAVPAIQLGHAGPKAATQRPWQGFGPLGDADAERGEPAWPTVAASARPAVDGWPAPAALDRAGLEAVTASFVAAAERALRAGFEVIELHAAHGYLLNSFLSPVSNHRDDEYGGDLAGRMRLPLEIARRLRDLWPAHLPMLARISAVDSDAAGTTVHDSVALARELGAVGVDVVDCSSGGVGARYEHPEHYGYQVPYAAAVRREAGVATMAVGHVVDPHQAAAIVADGEADLVALGRAALEDPNWPLHAEAELASGGPAPHASWHVQARWALERRAPLLARLGPWVRPAGEPVAPDALAGRP